MLKYQITLIAVLIGCVAFVACDRAQQVLEPVMPDPEMPDTGDMTGMMDMNAYMSWEYVEVGPDPDNKGDIAHDLGSRKVYFNEIAAMANKAGTAYENGAIIVKEAMNADDTAVTQVVTMMKTDDMMHAANKGWVYGTPQPLSAEMGNANCYGCHANAANDFVFVSLSKMEDDGTGDATGDGTGDATGDGTGDATGDGTGDATGDGTGDATGDGTGNGDGTGDGAGNGDGTGNGAA